MNAPEPHDPCERAAMQRLDLRDGCLGVAEADALRAHLDACPRCREEQAWDDRLRERLGDLTPVPAGLGDRVRRRVRRRRLWRAGVAVAAAALLAAGLVAWQKWPQAPREPIAVRPEAPSANARNDLPEAPFLFAAPPVDSLDLLARQQAGYVAALRQLEKE